MRVVVVAAVLAALVAGSAANFIPAAYAVRSRGWRVVLSNSLRSPPSTTLRPRITPSRSPARRGPSLPPARRTQPRECCSPGSDGVMQHVPQRNVMRLAA